MILLMSLVIHFSPPMPSALNMSPLMPEGQPAAFPFFISYIAVFTSLTVTIITGPSIISTSSNSPLSFSTLSSSLKYSFHLSLICFPSTRSQPCLSLMVVTCMMSFFCLALCLAILYIFFSPSCLQFVVPFLPRFFFGLCYCLFCFLLLSLVLLLTSSIHYHLFEGLFSFP